MNKIIKILILLNIFYLFSYILFAGETLFKIEPWNGFASAVSLTFDDGDPIHFDFAIPEMQKRNIRGAFFLVAGKLIRQNEWKRVSYDAEEFLINN